MRRAAIARSVRMFLVPILLLAGLFLAMSVASAAKKKGTITDSSYQTVVSLGSIIVVLASLAVMFLRLHRR